MAFFSVAPDPPGENEAILGLQANQLLTSMQVEPSRVDAVLSQAADHLNELSGGGLAALLATAALSGRFDSKVFELAMSDTVLRQKQFSPADQALLAHVQVAIRLRAPRMRGLPFDVALSCLAQHNSMVTSLQGIFDPVALCLRRMGVSFLYRQVHQPTGYLLWLTLPPSASVGSQPLPSSNSPPRQRSAIRGIPAGSIPGSLPGRAALSGRGMGAGSWVLEVDGPWSSIPGTNAPSLASRLYQANLQAAGLRVARVLPSERERLLGPGAARAIDVKRQGDDEGMRSPRVISDRSEAQTLPELLAHIVKTMALS